MTAQKHEILFINGKRVGMAYCPPLPKNDSRVKLVYPIEIEYASTNCWRGYVGTWMIRGDKFYLRNLLGAYSLESEKPIHADWVNAVLRVPRGEMLYYIHMGYASIFEREILIKIEKGVATRVKMIDNRGKDIDEAMLGFTNLPGFENEFEGNDF